MQKKTKAFILGGLGALAVIAFLAFYVFGVHLLFIDDEANEALPVFDSLQLAQETAATQAAAAALIDDADLTAGELLPEEVERITTAVAEATAAALASSTDTQAEDPAPVAASEIVTAATGDFISHDHPSSGTANVLTDGNQTFLRFEDDFKTDNGPDLNVYLSAGEPADGDAGRFDDDFIDLGDLTGNIGSQNYEIPPGTDLSKYNTVVIWCVRFGVAFGAADIA